MAVGWKSAFLLGRPIFRLVGAQPSPLLICSSFSREKGHPLLISKLSPAGDMLVLGIVSVGPLCSWGDEHRVYWGAYGVT